ncbi:somatostatin receptor type 5-like isoform X1 [Syngnathus typhle]|uniref:somatostatin receptor type 5-like isoform X1 n=1 Tax=Syngnathus typhle TaxID=161592 RepID=UPI002A6B1A19|nr:somatostatin receptor type 5-like isoform X1 [Syngnathus typhle]
MADYNMTASEEAADMAFSQHNGSTSNETEPLAFRVVTGLVYSVVFMVGLLGNSLAIFVVIRYTKMKTVTNLYILNLAVADELYILGIPFLATNSVLYYWPYGDFFCKVCMTADAMSQFMSTFCLTVMSIDRYLAVVHPVRSLGWRRPRVARIFSAMLWLVSFLVVLPVTIYSHVQEGFDTCNITWPEMQNWWSVVFILYTSILGFFAPLLIISICYLLIVIKVRSAGARAGVTKRRKSERKATRMVVIIVLVFVLCWMPFFTTNIVNLVHIIPENNATAAVYFFLVILTYVNSCANPILYGFLSVKFRESFQKVLCFHKGQNVASAARTDNHLPLFPARNPNRNGNVHNSQPVQMEAAAAAAAAKPDNDSSNGLNGQSKL